MKYLTHTGLRAFGGAVAIAAVLSLICAGDAHANRDAVHGTIRVIDGDTFEGAGTKIRLHAIDAPEMDQICVTEQGADWACGGWISKVVSDR